jgi:hypothetical protein
MRIRWHSHSYVPAIEADARRIICSRAGGITESYNYCRQASLRLMDDLLLGGFDARMLRCEGLKTEAASADERWLALCAPSLWTHFIVQLGSDVIDLTRRQFFPYSAFPYVQSFATCETEWTRISTVD